MIALPDLLDRLGYTDSSQYLDLQKPENAFAGRDIIGLGVKGVYQFKTNSVKSSLSSRPAIFVAECQNDDEAKKIHKSLWNFGNAPFIIIDLPHQLRVYTGFEYSPKINKKTKKKLV